MVEPHEQRIERILTKLEKVRHQGLTCFGSESHQFQLAPPLDESTLTLFEAEHRVVLPPDYRSFLKLAGNGGAGPYYGLYQLEHWNACLGWPGVDASADLLALPCPLTPANPQAEDWEHQLGGFVSPYQGMITIGVQGCSYWMGLIVTGEYAGRVAYLDSSGLPPHVVREADFLSWYERWLDELLGGYDMFWFGFGLGGDEPTLLALLNESSTSDADRIEAVHALRRLPSLSPMAREETCRLLTDPVPGVRAAACYVAAKFTVLEATEFLPELLNDASADVYKAANHFSANVEREAQLKAFLKPLRCNDFKTAKQAFFTLQEHELMTRDVLLELVQTSPHGELRLRAEQALDALPGIVSSSPPSHSNPPAQEPPMPACPACNREVEAAAESCPHCGIRLNLQATRPPDQGSRTSSSTFSIVILVITFLVGVVLCGGGLMMFGLVRSV